MKRLLISWLFLLSAAVANAAPDSLYVVKVDSDVVFIDITTSSSPVYQGMVFEVFTQGEELINPVTGVHLGALKTKVGAGSISAVQEKYAQGRLESGLGKVKPGHIANIAAPAPAPYIEAQKTARSGAPLWKSAAIDGHVTALALVDADGDGKKELAAVLDDKLVLYSADNGKLVVKASLELPNMLRPLSLDAHGKQLLLTGYQTFLTRFQTMVYALEDGQLKQQKELKWLVRSLERPARPPMLVSQQLYSDSNHSRTKVKELIESDDSWKAGEVLKYPRLDWLYGFTILDFDGDGEDELLYVMPSGKLRMQYKEGNRSYEYGDVFDRTPNRLDWQGQFLKFYPRIIARTGKDGRPEACLLYNVPSNGVLADTFGRYNAAEIACHVWTGTAIEQTWSAPMAGYAYDFDWGSFAGMAEGAVSVQVSGDKSFVVVLPR